MSATHERVTSAEILAITREATQLLRMGDQASEASREALRDRKIDLLNRIATDSDLWGNEIEAEQVRQIAGREAAALRLERVETWGESA